MPDINGVCRCGGTGEDGCTPTVRVPTEEERQLARRTGLYRELIADQTLLAVDAEIAETSCNPLLGADVRGNPLLAAPGDPHPLLTRAARHDPVLAGVLSTSSAS